MATYLQTVNNVLKRLREPTVSSVDTGTAYAAMIGIMVNDAKREVEDAVDWNCLSQTINVTTAANTYNYTLTGAGTRFRVIDILNDTKDYVMRSAPTTWMNQQFLLTSYQTGSPIYYNFNGVDENNDTQVDVFPVPDAVETLRFNLVVPQDTLTSDSTRILVPAHLVEMLAYAKAIAERGEDGGNLASEAFALYRSALANEISIERNHYEDEMNWKPL